MNVYYMQMINSLNDDSFFVFYMPKNIYTELKDIPVHEPPCKARQVRIPLGTPALERVTLNLPTTILLAYFHLQTPTFQ